MNCNFYEPPKKYFCNNNHKAIPIHNLKQFNTTMNYLYKNDNLNILIELFNKRLIYNNTYLFYIIKYVI